MSESQAVTRIHLLDEIVANQIAAGEVVERPVSVVKELVENALDAGAKNITVVLADGGRSAIEVRDDGSGMNPEDASLAIERFATSKLTSADELQRIASFGFRGEALPSIASVSKFTVETSDGGTGTEIFINGGKKERTAHLHAVRGTTIKVRDLFFNVPARRSFLRSEKTELGLIRSLLTDFGVSHPEVRFVLICDGEESLILPAQQSTDGFAGFKNRARELKLAGADPMECSGELETPGGVYRMLASLTKPLDCVAGAGRLRLLVNGRSVRDKILLRAVRDAYGNFLRSDRFPAGVVHLIVPPAELDVNVHPQKAEVRYRSPDRVFGVVRQGIGVTLRRESASSSGAAAFEDGAPASFSSSGAPTAFAWNSGGAASAEAHAAPGREISLTEYRLVGQIFSCYLLLEHGNGLFAIVDMHAAHERVMFAKFKKEWTEGELRSQGLLIPETIELPLHLRSSAPEIISLLESIGFELDPLGADTFVIRTVPALLSRFAVGPILQDLLSGFSFEDVEGALERKIDAILSRIACHGSVRSGQELSPPEVYQLLADLESTELRAFCPHGRSVARVLTRDELERLFGRQM